MKELDKILNFDETIAKDLFAKAVYPWEVLPNIKDFILEYGPKLEKDAFEEIKENVWVSKSATISLNATIVGPAIIDENSLIGNNAYIRQNVIIGKNVVIGNCSEVKNVVIFNKTSIPHFNYVGDSIIGYNAHLGAGVIVSNLKSDNTTINIKINDTIIKTNLQKFGAIVGDNVEIGCNTVLNPGTIINCNTTIYPLQSIRGYIEESKIYKARDNITDRV